jgi:hypothetical protein
MTVSVPATINYELKDFWLKKLPDQNPKQVTFSYLCASLFLPPKLL